MPKRQDIKKVMIIGAGPIVIGQACEFDYSGTQACKAIKEEGYEVILVNSNPATIMTDPDFADRTYIEPLTVEFLEKIIKIERPDAILPTVGGQTALNLAVQLSKEGILEKYGVEMIGAKLEAIEKAEDRELFKKAMQKIGLSMPESREVYSIDEAVQFVNQHISYPAIVRPAFTLGGTGSGIAYNEEELRTITARGLAASSIHQVLIEQSIIGWKEFELEVMRDHKDNCVIVCSIENLDPMGVHTGDSITVAPIQTLTDKEYQHLRRMAFAIIREIGVDTGGSNVQFAINPANGQVMIIEMNPRVSRSSALASKATGFPIAKIAAKLALGYTLDEIPNDITKTTPSSFEPSIDYVVTKIPRFDFEKFPDSDPRLGTQMKSVGEVMAIGRSFQESFWKALQSLETRVPQLQFETLEEQIRQPNANRIHSILFALEKGISEEKIITWSQIDPWFIKHLALLVQNKPLWPKQVVYKKVDTCAGEFEAQTPYYYSTSLDQENEDLASDKAKIMILGGGPNRIGQGIEFDYCCVHAAFALKKEGFETIMVNCNPETVSTDYDTADRLYFEPLTLDSILNIVKNEKPKGVIVQYGGQTPLKLALALEKNGVPIIGTSAQNIHLAEDRKQFGLLMEKMKIAQPRYGTALSVEEAIEVAHQIGFPVMVRPSYVLGGRAMEICFDDESLKKYILLAAEVSPNQPILIDQFLENATEIDVDAICDGNDAVICGVMEHVEYAGIHSGDSACVLPPHHLEKSMIEKIKRVTCEVAKALQVKGLINIQWAVQNKELFMIEVNPRASRTIPFVSKATGIAWAQMGARVMVGKTIRELNLSEVPLHEYSVKEVVLPFNKFLGQDIVLGPEMRSTGEVMGHDKDLGMAFAKSILGAGEIIPVSGTAFLSCNDRDKNKDLLSMSAKLLSLGFQIVATKGTADFLIQNGLKVENVLKVRQGNPNIVDEIINNKIQLVINTPRGKGPMADDYYIRQAALKKKIYTTTTLAGALALVEAISAMQTGELHVRALQDRLHASPVS